MTYSPKLETSVQSWVKTDENTLKPNTSVVGQNGWVGYVESRKTAIKTSIDKVLANWGTGPMGNFCCWKCYAKVLKEWEQTQKAIEKDVLNLYHSLISKTIPPLYCPTEN